MSPAARFVFYVEETRVAPFYSVLGVIAMFFLLPCVSVLHMWGLFCLCTGTPASLQLELELHSFQRTADYLTGNYPNVIYVLKVHPIEAGPILNIST